MKKQKQKVVSKGIGDCFAACMSTLLELPIEVMPNDHSEYHFIVWNTFLGQFGLELTYRGDKGPIWHDFPWIASVPSLNYENTSHAIIVDCDKVLFDPSTKKIYKKGTKLLGKKIVTGGYTLVVSDPAKLYKLEEYRQKYLLSKNEKLDA